MPSVLEGTRHNKDTQEALVCVNETYEAGDGRNEYITYAANKLIEAGMTGIDYNWFDFIATWQHEGDWNPEALNTGNSNGTTDHGICQLNSRWHGPMVTDKERMADPYKQIDYCVGVAVDAKRKRTMPWSAWTNGSKEKHKYKFNFDYGNHRTKGKEST